MWTSGESMGRRLFELSQRERDLGRVHSPAGGRAVENDVGHFLAAEALDALLAEDPLDGIDDVRLSRPVGTDDHRDSGGELEPRLIGEAFETGEFKRLEHNRKGGAGREPNSLLYQGRGEDETKSEIEIRNKFEISTNDQNFGSRHDCETAGCHVRCRVSNATIEATRVRVLIILLVISNSFRISTFGFRISSFGLRRLSFSASSSSSTVAS